MSVDWRFVFFPFGRIPRRVCAFRERQAHGVTKALVFCRAWNICSRQRFHAAIIAILCGFLGYGLATRSLSGRQGCLSSSGSFGTGTAASAGGVTSAMAGYKPTRILTPPRGTSGSSLKRSLEVACQYSELRNSFSPSAAALASSVNGLFKRLGGGGGAIGGPGVYHTIKTPSRRRVAGFGGLTFHSAPFMALYMLEAARLDSRSGIYSIVAVDSLYGRRGAVDNFPLAYLKPISLGALQIAKSFSTCFSSASCVLRSFACFLTASALRWAPSAVMRAALDFLFAFPASLPATSAEPCACWADKAALPASCVMTARSWSLLALK